MTRLKKRLSALALLPGLIASTCAGASAQPYPGWYGDSLNGPGQITNQQLRAIQRQQRQEYRAEQQRQRYEAQRQARLTRQAEIEARRPHPVSAPSNGQLTFISNVSSLVSNRTLYLESPIYANNTFQKWDISPVFLASDGKSYSSRWSGDAWWVQGSNLCISHGQEADCMTAMSDASGQRFLQTSNGILILLGKIGTGDSANIKEAYAQATSNNERAAAGAAVLLGLLMAGAMSGGGGGGSGSSSDNIDRLRAHQGNGGGSYEPAPSYTAPIGGETGLYGSSHGVGD